VAVQEARLREVGALVAYSEDPPVTILTAVVKSIEAYRVGKDGNE